jgi:hypothetical protein
MRRVLVCGGRDYIDSIHVCDVLGRLHEQWNISVLIHGDAPGADQRAKMWARSMKIPEVGYPADWKTHGKAAGPIRNQKMLDEMSPDVVVAFPGGRGTADMCRRARAHGIAVIPVQPRTEAPQADQHDSREK